MTRFTSIVPEQEESQKIQGIADRILTATGIDVMKDKLKLTITWKDKVIVEIDIGKTLTRTQESSMETEFPELKTEET